MLVLRRYGDILDLLPFYQSPQKVMPHVNVLRVGVGNRALCDLNGTLVILIHGNSRHPSLLQHNTPNLPRKQNILPHVRHSLILRLSSREYLERVTHFCVLECHETGPPAHITTPPDTLLVSVLREA